jgi:hypothetical protein
MIDCSAFARARRLGNRLTAYHTLAARALGVPVKRIVINKSAGLDKGFVEYGNSAYSGCEYNVIIFAGRAGELIGLNYAHPISYRDERRAPCKRKTCGHNRIMRDEGHLEAALSLIRNAGGELSRLADELLRQGSMTGAEVDEFLKGETI